MPLIFTRSICERIFPGPTYLLDRVHTSGVTGIVTDQLTGMPVQAEVRLLEYYADYLPPRMSDANGRYYRYLLQGESYSLEFIAEGYDTTRVLGVIAYPDFLTMVDVEMTPYVGIDQKDPAGHIPAGTFSVSQNHPNPFNPSTTITFEIPDKGGTGIPGSEGSLNNVRLVIYNLRGRQVKSLVDSQLDPGRYDVVWDGRNDRGEAVTSGIYLYSLITAGKRYTRKMTVLK